MGAGAHAAICGLHAKTFNEAAIGMAGRYGKHADAVGLICGKLEPGH